MWYFISYMLNVKFIVVESSCRSLSSSNGLIMNSSFGGLRRGKGYLYTIVLGNLTFMKVHDYCCFLFIHFFECPPPKSQFALKFPILFLEFLSFYKVKLSLNSIFFFVKIGRVTK